MTRILYFGHDLDDPAIWRRCELLRRGGAAVDLVGFRRATTPLPGPARVLGRTHNGQMIQRVGAVVRARTGLARALRGLERPDLILARNLETLPLAIAAAWRFGRPRIRTVYEVLDIHRLLLREDAVGRALRRAERRFLGGVDAILISSPAFRREYFSSIQPTDRPIHLVENRVVGDLPSALHARADDGEENNRPLVIGWFGILRCAVSLACLDEVTRRAPGRYKVILRGRPARDAIPEFDRVIAANPDLVFEGAYEYPTDLPRIYGEIDLAWLVDRYDAGQNSDWLIPNRFYESGANGVPPVGLCGTQIAREMERYGIGLCLEGAEPEDAVRALETVTPQRLAALRTAQRRVPAETWIAGPAEGRHLIEQLCGTSSPRSVTAAEAEA